ncbi:hypothetical protein BuS5_03073 [Desulfosarcina sp. BuS5]|uniref:Gfo/Idh/MocA family protein n=1 Tax=Desulfosarcina sp. BuS5 TaxID=933262 RepID=UPI00047F5903|nr:Gfo/Idh/MocA family oxidoreductase [Desulfosarcina sp. BuS5]WDN90103.1 hypothetical protein BuS5_03073 [Desulfosarcina sp. BuS5]
MKKLRIGVVGVGYLGKFHTEKYANMENVDLVGVVDIDKSRADNIAAEFNTLSFLNHKDLVNKIDAASIVASTPEHYKVAKDFLENGIDVMIEKPITTSIADADRLIDLAEEKGLIIQVGHLERFNPAVVALRNIIKKPMFIESHRLSFYKERGIDVSVVLDLMIHDIDLISNFVRSEIKSIHASGVPVISEHVDIANARLEFKNGCVANITASRISIKNERKIRLFQKDAYISVDFSNYKITIIRKTGSNKKGLIPGMEVENISFQQGDALNDELISFVKSVQNRTSPEVTGEMGRDALKIAISTMQQIKNANSKLLNL